MRTPVQTCFLSRRHQPAKCVKDVIIMTVLSSGEVNPSGLRAPRIGQPAVQRMVNCPPSARPTPHPWNIVCRSYVIALWFSSLALRNL